MRARQAELLEDVHDAVARGYDSLAAAYDDDIGSNAVGVRMHKVFQEAASKVFGPGQRVFEIGCGSGIDALWLAGRGVEVVATDISGEMVRQVERKAAEHGLSARVRLRRLAARDIGTLTGEFGESSFDGGYCHAGALNMEPDLTSVPRQVASLIRPGGTFVCSFINKTSLFELLFYPIVLRPRKAFRRLGNVIPIPISRLPPLNRYVVPTRFYTGHEMARFFRSDFRVEHFRGLQVFLPPSNLADYYARAAVAFAPLERLEDRLSDKWPFKLWGHHTILTLRRLSRNGHVVPTPS